MNKKWHEGGQQSIHRSVEYCQMLESGLLISATFPMLGLLSRRTVCMFVGMYVLGGDFNWQCLEILPRALHSSHKFEFYANLIHRAHNKKSCLPSPTVNSNSKFHNFFLLQNNTCYIVASSITFAYENITIYTCT